MWVILERVCIHKKKGGVKMEDMKYKLINFRISEELAREFKSRVAKEGTNMTRKILEWIEEYVEN